MLFFSSEDYLFFEENSIFPFRSQTMSPLVLDPRIRVTSTMTSSSTCNRDVRALTTLSGSLIIFEEGDFEPGPPPVLPLPYELLPVPSYNSVAQETLPPPVYEP